MKILIAMISSVYRDELLHQLSQSGYQVIAVKTGDQALNQIRKVSFDAVIVQINLPNFDGLELILTAKDMHLNIPIIAFDFESSCNEKEIKIAGASEVIKQEVAPVDMISVLKGSLTTKNYLD